MKSKIKENTAVGDWGKELALIWTNYLPPCRPSNSELLICSKHLENIRRAISSKPKVLVLGSTPEFRDWAFQENCHITVIDKSRAYNKTISRELRHKHIEENLIILKWQDMNFSEKFDMIVGDLVIGNIEPNELDVTLNKISGILSNNGVFITKSFFANDSQKIRPLKEIFESYKSLSEKNHPYPSLIYAIAQSCLNWNNYVLDFNLMYQKIKKLYEDEIIDRELFEVFASLGWETNMKFGFYMPSFKLWEKSIQKYFSSFTKELGNDIYSKDFPVYIISK